MCISFWSSFMKRRPFNLYHRLRTNFSNLCVMEFFPLSFSHGPFVKYCKPPTHVLHRLKAGRLPQVKRAAPVKAGPQFPRSVGRGASAASVMPDIAEPAAPSPQGSADGESAATAAPAVQAAAAAGAAASPEPAHAAPAPSEPATAASRGTERTGDAGAGSADVPSGSPPGASARAPSGPTARRAASPAASSSGGKAREGEEREVGEPGEERLRRKEDEQVRVPGGEAGGRPGDTESLASDSLTVEAQRSSKHSDRSSKTSGPSAPSLGDKDAALDRRTVSTASLALERTARYALTTDCQFEPGRTVGVQLAPLPSAACWVNAWRCEERGSGRM